MKKNVIKLNESSIKKIVAESVRKVLKEWNYDPIYGDYAVNPSSELDDLNDEPQNIKHWYDEDEHTYKVYAMIKSDMNPISYEINAGSIEEAIDKATNYFVKFSSTHDKKDVDIFNISHNDYNGI